MRIVKIRGHRRHWKVIKKWSANNHDLNLKNLKDRGYDYTKIWVHPWSGLNMSFSEIPHPRGQTKRLMLEGLTSIYTAWKEKLDSLGEPFYLKIWYFEPRIAKSQFVCAIGDYIDYYNGIFEEHPQPDNYFDNIPKTLQDKFDWDCGYDYIFYDKSDLLWPADQYSTDNGYLYDRRLLRKLEKGNYKSELITIGDVSNTAFSVPAGRIWTGKEKLKTHHNKLANLAKREQ